ncbi:MAG: hypothetical protein EYC70_00605 [Planctomycetota bacterium]|nr:MAG: hypothetical protein EYC70_00605 [Planctomycetota bacterium]
MDRLTALWSELQRRTDHERTARGSVAAFDLAPVTALLQRLGSPQAGAVAVHVAGSKGKGSTCHFLERGLRAAGRRTGLYTSPHLSDWRERIQVAGAPASDALLADALERSLRAARGPETVFDLLTAAAFTTFRAAGCDVWVVEVGLGGRLDSTNVIQSVAALVTSIEREHVEILGDSLQAIAREKAGIYKRGAQLWSGLESWHPARAVLAQRAADLGQDLLELPDLAARRPDLPYPQPHMQRNYALAAAVLQQTFPGAAAALHALPAAALAIPGRWERGIAPDGRPVVFDMAHTASSLSAALAAFRREFPGARRGVVLALRRDKDAAGIAAALPPRPDGESWWTAPAGDHPESADPAALAPVFGATPLRQPGFPPGPEVLLITGSTYLVGFLRTRLHA